MHPPLVIKIGGTSVQDAAAIRNVAEIISRAQERRLLVVVSACAGVTDSLGILVALSEQGYVQQALELLETLHLRHRTMVVPC